MDVQKGAWHHLGKWVEPALAAELWLEYAKYAQQFFAQKLDGKILYLNGDFFLSKHDADLMQQEGYAAAKSKNTAFFNKIRDAVVSVSDSVVRAAMSARSVLDFLEKYQELTGIWMPLNSVALGAEQYVSETDPSAFAAADGRTAEKPWTLAQVDEMRVLKKTLGGAFKKFDLLSESAKGKVRAHISKYEWKGSHHLSVHQFTVKELMKQMAEDKSIQRPKSRRDIEPYLVGLLDLLGFVRFRCAEASGKSSYYLAPLLSELAEKHNVSYDDVVEHTIDEIAKGTITKAIAEKRRKSTGFLFDKRKIVLTDKQVQECANVLLGGAIASEVQGIAACKGIAKGVVKLVRSKEEMKGFEKGMILVAYETTPDVVSAMKKAGAIVTDFGGLTSHAAIISREFGIPCIVGTKNATKVLKDGDMVEVDADKGVVRKV